MSKIVKSIGGAVVVGISAMIPVARADLVEFDIDKNLVYTQTNAAGSLTFNSAFFASRLDQTTNAYNTAQLSSPNFPAQPYTLNAAGTEFALSQSFATQAAMDAAYPFGTYTAHAQNTVTMATNSDTISYTQDAYPSTQGVVTPATFTGLQGMNANAPFTINYNGFTPAPATTPGQSFEFIDIFNSMGTEVFSDDFLPNTQTSVTLPAGTLMPGMAYTLSVDYSDRIQGTSTTGTNILYDYDTAVQFTTAAVPAPVIGRGLPVLLAVGGILWGAKLSERSKKRRSLATAIAPR
jgi:hypothetical protein